METSAVVLTRPGTPPSLERILVDEPGPGEALVKVAAAGVCQTDLDAVRDARIYPVVLGHEGAGTIIATGVGVDPRRIGDRVVISWRVRCGECPNCLAGRRAFCEDVRATASPRLHGANGPLGAHLNAGTFSGLAVVPAAGAVGIDPEVPFDVAALIGCGVATGLGAAIHAAGIRVGDTVAVTGVGAVGLSAVIGALLAGAGQIIAVDLSSARLSLARRLGATDTVEASGGSVTDALLTVTAGRGVDHVIEATGSVDVMRDALPALARGGTLTLVGAAPRPAELRLHPRDFMSRQLRLHGCIFGEIEPQRDLAALAGMYRQGRLPLDELLSARITLTEVPALFQPGVAATPDRSAIRTIISLEESG